MQVQILTPQLETTYKLPIFISQVQAGFPSPATDYEETKLDLNSHLIANPNSTFFVRIDGESMVGCGIKSGDIAIVDRSLEPKHNDIILAVVDGDFTIKRLDIREINHHKTIRLLPENEEFEPIIITENIVFQIWGVVTYTINKTK
jgi:DNA polymerase V